MFAHRLALELGEWDVDALLEKIPFSKLRRWMAYHRIEPFGFEREQWLTASVCAAVLNSQGAKRKDGNPLQPDDVLPVFGPADDDEPVDVESLRVDPEKMKAVMEMFGASFKKVQ